jgi:hypothetical protein
MIKKFTNNCNVEEEELKSSYIVTINSKEKKKIDEKEIILDCNDEEFKETSTQCTDLKKIDCFFDKENSDPFGGEFGYESEENEKDESVEESSDPFDGEFGYESDENEKNKSVEEEVEDDEQDLEEIEVTDKEFFTTKFLITYEFKNDFLKKNVDCMKIRLSYSQCEDLMKFEKIGSVHDEDKNLLKYDDKNIKIRRKYYYVIIAQMLLLYQNYVYKKMVDLDPYLLKDAMNRLLEYRDDTELTDLFHSLINLYKIKRDKNFFKYCWCIPDMLEYVSKL